MGTKASDRLLPRASGHAPVAFAVAALLATYVATRHLIPHPWARPVSQVVFLVPILGAAILLPRAAIESPPGSRGRRIWFALALSAVAMLVSEASVAYPLIFGAPMSSTLTGLFDGANVVAFLGVGTAIALRVRVDRFGWRRAMRMGLDLLALVALTFALLHRFWASQGIGSPVGGDPVYHSAYGVLGLVLILGGAASFWSQSARRLSYNAVIGLSIVLTGVGVELSVAVADQTMEGRSSPLAIVSSGVFLVAYALMFGGAWLRLRGEHPTTPARVPRQSLSSWPGVAVSGLVFVSVVWLGLLAIESEPGTRAEAVYLAAASIAALCAVGRTALAHAETDELTKRSLRDHLTGAWGPRAFDAEVDALLRVAGESGGAVALFSVDLDDFAKINAVHGYRTGDRCLAAVAASIGNLTDVERLFRLTGDEFVALCALGNQADAERVARCLLVAVRTCDCGVPLAASIGFAVSHGDVARPDELLHRARLAGLWAKRHGKDRAIRYDRRVGETLSLDERLALGGERARMDMAKALLAAADARDPANHWHARNVAALARLLGEDLGLEPSHVDRVEMAAILHDVGKIALPDIMLGGRTLTFQERSVAREHVRLGERLVESLAVEGVGRWIRSHHENWDGSGYPDGLEGDRIPLESRIIALADAYDGMTMGKRYGAPMSKAAALQEIDLGIGVRFDPELAERFIRLVGTTTALGWSDEWASA